MRKGQYTIVEQVILFALGVSITVGFLFAFKDLSANVKDDMKGVQAELVAEYLASTSIELVESGAEGRMNVPVPDRIASESYAVSMGQGGVRVQVAGNQEIAPLYGLGSRAGSGGTVESGQGSVSVVWTGDRLELRRAE